MNTTTIKAVEVEKLEKKFEKFVAVNKISFSVDKGEIFGFLGPNGAGKSTTIRMLCGIIIPTSGNGHVSGFDINKEQEMIKQNIGYMSQKFSLYHDLTVEENIDFYSGIYRIPKDKKKERKEWVIKMAELGDLRTRLTATLSSGWKQHLALGCAIIHEPKIVFLDEPTSGVDPISRHKFWDIIKNLASSGVTVFVTTHNMDEAEYCDRIALIYQGDIIASGTPQELKTDFMKEDVLKINLDNPESWMEKFNQIKEIKETALFGASIHAVTWDLEKAISSIKNLIFKEGVKQYEIKEITPSLEDVFVSLIEAQDREGKKNELFKN